MEYGIWIESLLAWKLAYVEKGSHSIVWNRTTDRILMMARPRGKIALRHVLGRTTAGRSRCS
jgi:hypothetical protein